MPTLVTMTEQVNQVVLMYCSGVFVNTDALLPRDV